MLLVFLAIIAIIEHMNRISPSIQILPGVRAIGWINCDLLQRRVDLHGICQAKIPVLTAITPVPFFDKAECSCKRSRESGRQAATATLKFRCADLLPIHLPLGFVVTDQNGKTYLIGSREHPQPVVKVEMGVGQCDGDGAGYEYEITHTALETLFEVAASY